MCKAKTVGHGSNVSSKHSNTTKLYGTYKGSKDSCGFKVNQTYFLKSRVTQCRIDGKYVDCIVISDVNSRACCPYQSLESLLKYWDIEYIR